MFGRWEDAKTVPHQQHQHCILSASTAKNASGTFQNCPFTFSLSICRTKFKTALRAGSPVALVINSTSQAFANGSYMEADVL